MTARTRAVMVTQGRKETERLVLEADGVAAMCNEDGSVTFDLYRDHGSSLRIRISPEDVASQSHIFKRWGRQ